MWGTGGRIQQCPALSHPPALRSVSSERHDTALQTGFHPAAALAQEAGLHSSGGRQGDMPWEGLPVCGMK